MSVLEIVLYSCLGVGFITWLIITIYEYKHPKAKKKKESKNEEKDDLE